MTRPFDKNLIDPFGSLKARMAQDGFGPEFIINRPCNGAKERRKRDKNDGLQISADSALAALRPGKYLKGKGKLCSNRSPGQGVPSKVGLNAPRINPEAIPPEAKKKPNFAKPGFPRYCSPISDDAEQEMLSAPMEMIAEGLNRLYAHNSEVIESFLSFRAHLRISSDQLLSNVSKLVQSSQKNLTEQVSKSALNKPKSTPQWRTSKEKYIATDARKFRTNPSKSGRNIRSEPATQRTRCGMLPPRTTYSSSRTNYSLKESTNCWRSEWN